MLTNLSLTVTIHHLNSNQFTKIVDLLQQIVISFLSCVKDNNNCNNKNKSKDNNNNTTSNLSSNNDKKSIDRGILQLINSLESKPFISAFNLLISNCKHSNL